MKGEIQFWGHTHRHTWLYTSRAASSQLKICCILQEKEDIKQSNAEDGSEDADAKAKEEKEDNKKDKKKKAKKGKARSESPEPMVLDDDHPDTQISAVEGSRGTGSGQAESKADKERGEVATPTHRCVW